MDDSIRHPTVREIVDLRVGGAGNDSAPETGGHIAGCDRCHTLYLGVLSLERRISEAFADGRARAACPEEWEIAAVVAGETGGNAAIRISSHLERCSYCIDRAARFHKVLAAHHPALKAPETWRNAAVTALGAGPGETGDIRSGFLERLREFLRGLSAALPPLPGYAAAVALVVLTIWLYVGDRKKAIVIPSTEKIAFRETQPTGSLGFMDQEAPQLPVKTMDLQSSGNRVVFRWEPPTGYSGYSFALVEKPGANVLWRRPDVRGDEIVVPGDLLSDDRVYTWLIEVTLADGRTIEYTGDFLYRR